MSPVLVFLIVHHHHSITDTVMSDSQHSMTDFNPGTHISFAHSIEPTQSEVIGSEATTKRIIDLEANVQRKSLSLV